MNIHIIPFHWRFFFAYYRFTKASHCRFLCAYYYFHYLPSNSIVVNLFGDSFTYMQQLSYSSVWRYGEKGRVNEILSLYFFRFLNSNENIWRLWCSFICSFIYLQDYNRLCILRNSQKTHSNKEILEEFWTRHLKENEKVDLVSGNVTTISLEEHSYLVVFMAYHFFDASSVFILTPLVNHSSYINLSAMEVRIYIHVCVS